MKSIIFILSFFLPATVAGQSCSLAVDSITEKRIEQLGSKNKNCFNRVVLNRISVNWRNRLDSLKFDYAFIDETIFLENDSVTVVERYFVKDDSIPKYVFINNEYLEPRKIYDNGFRWYSQNVISRLTLYPLLETYTKLQEMQELPYDRTQIWTHGCVVFNDSERKFKKQRKIELKQTYRIQTLINRINNNLLVSFQFAPKKPKFRTHSYNPVWDW